MIGTLAWKEYREHQSVWVAMTGLAIVLIVTLTQVLAPNSVATAPADKLHTIALAALILVGTYGLTCGAMMVAGEEEGRTQTFLDILPASRTRVWITKLLMGGLFTLAYALVVTGVLAALGLTEASALPSGWQLALPLVALETCGYGLFGSVLARSVLAAVGWALVPVTLSWLIGGEGYWPPSVLVVAIRTVLLLALVAVSGLVYCRLDFQRGRGSSADLPARRAMPGQGGWGPESESLPIRRTGRTARSAATESWRVLAWLALRQGWAKFLLLAAVGFLVGRILPNAALAIWPAASLLVGVAFGIGMFSGEQAGDAYRFLGSQRLPPSRVWLAKVITWSGMAVAVLAVMLLGAAMHFDVRHLPRRSVVLQQEDIGMSLGSPLLLDYVPKEVFLLVWPIYGFSVGQSFALVCRKSAVALVLSVLVSVPIAGLWIPSLVTGGLKLWQIVPPAALLLLATRMGIWAWAGDRLKSWQPVLGFAGCIALAVTWLGSNPVYRAVEVPELGERFAMRALLADLPAPEQNPAGSLIHRAMHELEERERFLAEKWERGVAGPPGAAEGVQAQSSVLDQEQIAPILEKGWPGDNAELASWLDEMCQGEWIEPLREAAQLPLGVVENPRLTSSWTRIDAKPVYQRAAQLLVVRALQLQAREDHAGALDHLLWALALSRNLRHQTLQVFYQQGQTLEMIALRGLDRWLERLGPQPRLLQRALDALNHHEELTPPATEPIRAEYLILRDRLDHPTPWLFNGTRYSSTHALERDLATLSLQTPWERERAARLLDAVTGSRLLEAQTPYWQLPLLARLMDRGSMSTDEASLLSLFVPDRQRAAFTAEQWQCLLADSRLLLRLFMPSALPQHLHETLSLCRVRAARLKLALALYQVNEGKPAPNLLRLVPRYLEELPRDPFTGGDFHYLVSTGQPVERWQGAGEDRPEWTHIPAGQGFLWSAVPAQDGLGQERALLGPDLIFIVPYWPP